MTFLTRTMTRRRRSILCSPFATALLACIIMLMSNDEQQQQQQRSVMAYVATSLFRRVSHPSTATPVVSLSMVRTLSEERHGRKPLTMSLDECSTYGGSPQRDPDRDGFELHVGRALDTLRSDYPKILTEDPDFSIYDRRIEIIDPSGVKVTGLRNYKAAFGLLHAITNIVYCPAKSTVQLRTCYDRARQNIRISWNVEAVPREIFGGSRTTAHVDGISVYELDRVSGNITQHRIERLLYNNRPVAPKEGIIAALKQEHAVTVPSFFQDEEQTVFQFRQQHPQPWNILRGKSAEEPPTSLFALEANGNSEAAAPNYDLDWEALELKNKSRKKFGLKPLTPEEFIELQAQVQVLSEQQEVKRQQQQAAAAAASKKQPGFWDKLQGGLLQDTCETNFDCERPQICCDFGFQKRCCSSGTMVGLGQQSWQPATVPVVAGYPRGQGPGDDPQNY